MLTNKKNFSGRSQQNLQKLKAEYKKPTGNNHDSDSDSNYVPSIVSRSYQKYVIFFFFLL